MKPFVLFLLSVVIFSLTTTVSFAEPTCKSPQALRAANMTPYGIRAWLKMVGTKVRTVRDFVCCLPQEYRSNFMIGHSSLAAQNGTPNSPRIIMTNQLSSSRSSEKEKKLSLMLSFNGGEHGMNQNKSIEMAFINPQTQQAEYFDLNFEDIRRAQLSPKNPETCMNCHGDSGKVPPGGPKLIFDPFNDWARFVGGATTCNPTEDRLQKLVSNNAVKSLNKNPQFDCLDKSQILGNEETGFTTGQTLPSFDNAMVPVIKRQRRNWISSLPKYQNYKYFLYGSLICDVSNLQDWMSPSIIRKNTAQLQIDPRLKFDGSLREVYKKAILDEEIKSAETIQMQKDYINKNGIMDLPMPINSSSRACENQMTKSYADSLTETLKSDSTKNFSNRNPMTLLTLDNALKKPRTTMTLPSAAARFFLEGEGYGTFFIQKSFSQGDMVHGGIEFPTERKDSELSALFERSPDGLIDINRPKYSIEKTCNELKSLSLHELSGKTFDQDVRGKH